MSSLVVSGDTSGSVTLQAPAVAGSVVVTLPSASGTMAVTGGSPSFGTLTVTGNANLATTSGNVGVGTASPASKLDVYGSAGVTTFTGTTRLGVTVEGPTSTNDYAGIDFADQGSLPKARIASVFTSSGSYLQFGTSSLYASGITNTAMTIDYQGNVGIGTSAPSSGKLNVAGNATISTSALNDSIGTLRVSSLANSNLNTAGIVFSAYDTANAVTNGAIHVVPVANYRSNFVSTYMADGAGGNYLINQFIPSSGSTSERMRIDSSGYIFMNTTTSSYPAAAGRLQVNGGGSASAVLTTSGGASYANAYVHNTATTGNNEFLAFGTEATWTARGSINYNRGAGLTAYNTTSDYRAKTLLGGIEGALNTLNSLKVHNAIMKEATIERPMFVAHELQVDAPYAVTGEKDAEDKDGNPVYQQVDTSALIPLLTKAIQELNAKVTALEAQLAGAK